MRGRGRMSMVGRWRDERCRLMDCRRDSLGTVASLSQRKIEVTYRATKHETRNTHSSRKAESHRKSRSTCVPCIGKYPPKMRQAFNVARRHGRDGTRRIEAPGTGHIVSHERVQKHHAFANINTIFPKTPQHLFWVSNIVVKDFQSSRSPITFLFLPRT